MTTRSGWFVTLLVLCCTVGVACVYVGSRSLDVGTDTRAYAGYFRMQEAGPVHTRMEPGFVWITELLSALGLGLTGYQAALFLLLCCTAVLAAREYGRYLRSRRTVSLVAASFMWLFLSPAFVNASINAIRQGLSSLVVFSALLSFARRRWLRFALFAALATSVHVSSILFVAFAPLLLVRREVLRWIVLGAGVLYCSGLAEIVLSRVAPGLHWMVVSYVPGTLYRSGVRLDFVVFSAFWYVLLGSSATWVRSSLRERVRESLSIYLVMLLPFFALGFGAFSNRFLLPAWLAVSVVLAALMCHSRVAWMRSRWALGLGLVVSCGVFMVFVNQGVVL